MKYESGAPFESIENAQEYLRLLDEVILEAREAVEADVRGKAHSGPPRRVEALRLVLYSLEKLAHHIKCSRRILNDLRTLRRLIQQERTVLSPRDQSYEEHELRQDLQKYSAENLPPELDLNVDG